jgi:chemotaxis protein methyltransferase CheR
VDLAMTQPAAGADDGCAPLTPASADHLAEMLHRHHGLDFRHYARTSRNRRLAVFMRGEGLASPEDLLQRLSTDPACAQRLLATMPVHVTELFRNPPVFRALRERILPQLATFPIIRVWLAGCASGEEAWSLAILLHEAGLYERSRIYATDFSPELITRARAGHLPPAVLPTYSASYQAAGGNGALTDYLTGSAAGMRFIPTLGRHVVFAVHNLAIDQSFNEFHLILCRNVMIYFDRGLQARVHRLLFASLARFGVLCLGDAEHLALSACAPSYETLDDGLKLYRKVGDHCHGPEAPDAP